MKKLIIILFSFIFCNNIIAQNISNGDKSVQKIQKYIVLNDSLKAIRLIERINEQLSYPNENATTYTKLILLKNDNYAVLIENRTSKYLTWWEKIKLTSNIERKEAVGIPK